MLPDGTKVQRARLRDMALARLSGRLSSPQQMALRVVAEGVPIEERLQFHAFAADGVMRPRR